MKLRNQTEPWVKNKLFFHEVFPSGILVKTIRNLINTDFLGQAHKMLKYWIHALLFPSKKGSPRCTPPAVLHVCWGSTYPFISSQQPSRIYLLYARSCQCAKAFIKETKTSKIPIPHKIGTLDACSSVLREGKSDATSACVWCAEGTLEQWGTSLLSYALSSRLRYSGSVRFQIYEMDKAEAISSRNPFPEL